MESAREFEFVLVKEESENEEQRALQISVDPLSGGGNLADPLAEALDVSGTTVNTKRLARRSAEYDTVSKGTVKSGNLHSGDDADSLQLAVPLQMFACALCPAVFVTKYSLIRHVFSHIEGVAAPSEVCELCGEVFPSAECLREHSLICQYEKHEGHCQCQCGNTAGRQCRFCQGYKHLECWICGKSFPSKTDLIAHERVHRGEESYKCDICGKLFLTNSILRNHKRGHAGDEVYKCEICGRSFSHTESSQFRKHVHKGEESYKCGICDKTFSYAHQFQYHKSIHIPKKRMKCGICGKSFAHPSHLATHTRMHT